MRNWMSWAVVLALSVLLAGCGADGRGSSPSGDGAGDGGADGGEAGGGADGGDPGGADGAGDPGGDPGGEAGGDGGADGGDEGGGEDGEAPVDLDGYLEAQNIEKLAPDEGGGELAQAPSDDEGRVRFYSPTHEAMWDLTLVDEAGAALAGKDVMVGVGQTGVTLFITDPSGEHAPLLVTTEMPVEDGSYEISAADASAGAQFVPEVAEDNPFTDGSFLLELNVSTAIRFTLANMKAFAIGAVIKSVVQGTCNFFAPLEKRSCSIAGDIAGLMAGWVKPGMTFLTAEGFGGLAGLVTKVAADVGAHVLNEMFCKPAGVAFMKLWLDDEASVILQLRQAISQYNWLLNKIDDDPPDDVDELQGQLAQVGNLITNMTQELRPFYLKVYNDQSLDGIASSVNMSLGFTKALIDTVDLSVDWAVEFGGPLPGGMADLLAKLKLEGFTHAIEKLDIAHSGSKLGEMNEHIQGALAECVFGFVAEAGVTFVKDATNHLVEASAQQIAQTSILVAKRVMKEIYKDGWGGGDVPIGACLPDLWEPNDTWEQAFEKEVLAGALGGDAVWINDVNLCIPPGPPQEVDDWYAFDAGPVNLRVNSKVVGVDGGPGIGRRACIEVWWYSEAMELMDEGATRVAGPECGALDKDVGPDVGRFAVGGAAGEAFRRLLVRVYADPDDPGAGEIAYSVGFIQ